MNPNQALASNGNDIGMSSRGGLSSASAVRNALKREKRRFDSNENAEFAALRQKKNQFESTQQFPRTLANKTFFTPHLPRGPTSNVDDHIARQYAVLFLMNGQPTVSISPYNPVGSSSRPTQSRSHQLNQQSHFPVGQPSKVLEKVHQLENAGYRFYGTNKDILVFERLYNPKQHAKQGAKRSAVIITASVALLTAALFVGEQIF